MQVHNDGGKHRVIVTKDLPGDRWLKILTGADCRVEVCQSPKVILDKDDVKQLLGSGCSAVLGQLTEVLPCKPMQRAVDAIICSLSHLFANAH